MTPLIILSFPLIQPRQPSLLNLNFPLDVDLQGTRRGTVYLTIILMLKSRYSKPFVAEFMQITAKNVPTHFQRQGKF